MDDDQLWEIERALWLQGVDTYEQRLAPEVLLVFPPPTGSLDRGQTLAAIGAAPRWHRVAFHNQRTAKPVTGMRVLAYLVTANRDGEPAPYVATCSSTYLRRNGRWLLAAHQQSPMG